MVEGTFVIYQDEFSFRINKWRITFFSENEITFDELGYDFTRLVQTKEEAIMMILASYPDTTIMVLEGTIFTGLFGIIYGSVKDEPYFDRLRTVVDRGVWI